MLLVLLTSFFIICTFIYSYHRDIRSPKNHRIFILLFLIIFISNLFFSYKYIQLQSSANYSTKVIFEQTQDQIIKISNLGPINQNQAHEDIRTLKNMSETLYSQSSLLVKQLNYTELVKGKNSEFTTILNTLNIELHKFISFHNKLFAQGKTISMGQVHLYDEFIEQLSNFLDSLSYASSASGTIMGPRKYQLQFYDEQLKELSTILKSISEIVDELISVDSQ